jgi:MFS family permease
MVLIQPIILIICRICDGLILGLFWPNLQSEISTWQEFSSQESNQKYYANFNLSFNLGFLIGYIVGYFIVFLSHNDLLALYISIILTGFMIPFMILYDEGKHLRFSDKKAIYVKQEDFNKFEPNSNPIFIVSDKNNNQHTNYLNISLWFCYGGSLIYSIGLALYIFALPFLIQNIGYQSHRVYILTFFQQFSQLLGISIINRISIKKQIHLYYFSILGTIILSIFMIIYNQITVIGIGMFLIGLFGGLIYGFALKIMFEYGTVKKSSKYAILAEVYLGIGFGVTPLLAGYIIINNFNGIFYALIIIEVIFFLISLIKINKP